MTKKKINVLETTLRDGSYAINFSFSTADTATLCKELESVGFEYIEIGHGVGLNASNTSHGKAAHTDEEYMIAAKENLTTSKYGMFCIPSVARLEDVVLAGDYDMNFIRIGTNVTEVETSKEFIETAKKAGMFVASNFMKSYALTPKKFAEKVKLSEKYGTDMLYIVDSAGGMFSEDIKDYFEAIREVSELPVGFHGHDNLRLGVANSIYAADLGIDFIDSSLQGLGRSSGNAATELLLLALEKKGYDTGVDYLKTLKIGDKYIKPILPKNGIHILDAISGFAEFHSSYMPHIQKFSAKYQVDPGKLIIELCKVDKINVSDDLLDGIAQRLQKEQELFLSRYGFDSYVGKEQDDK